MGTLLQTVVQFCIDAMFKRLILPFSIALVSSAALSEQAFSCYMETPTGRIDLSHMCGNGGSTTSEPIAPTAPPAPSTQPTIQQQPEVFVTEPIARFQVRRINASTGEAQGTVAFTSDAPMGASVNYWVEIDGQRRWLGVATRERGQRRVDVNFQLPAGTSLNDIKDEGIN